MFEFCLFILCDYICWVVSCFYVVGLFFGYGIDNVWDEVCYLVLGFLYFFWEIFDSYLDCCLEDDECVELVEIFWWCIEEWILVVYLLGEVWFCGIFFSVDECVLVLCLFIVEFIE